MIYTILVEYQNKGISFTLVRVSLPLKIMLHFPKMENISVLSTKCEISLLTPAYSVRNARVARFAVQHAK